MNGRSRFGQRGFSLLEVLVAFAIMALSLGALYQAAGGSVRAAAASELRLRATMLAESLLAAYPSVPRGGLAEAGQSPDGLSWSVSGTLHASEVPVPPGWPLYRLEIDVRWSAEEPGLSVVTLVPERWR